MYRKKFNCDYNNGIKNECKVLKYLNSIENNNYTKLGNNDCFDFQDKNIYIELKSRNNKSDLYATTMVGLNKIKIAEQDKENTYKFLFLFYDGLFEWQFNKDQYNISKGGRNDRGRPEFKNYAYIPIEYLKLITTDIKSKKPMQINTKEIKNSPNKEI